MLEPNARLRRYVEDRSEEDFRALVDEFLPLVYSAALRQTNGDAAMAADIAQTVFCDLSLKARKLPPDVVLGGWLYRHTSFTAAKAVRSEARRKAREQEAMNMRTLENEPPSEWAQIAPLLDEAMNGLGESDRDAIVLRFLEGLSLRDVGVALGTNEDAAQKRVSRALDKLREFFTGKGVTVSTTTLASLLGANAIAAVPGTLSGSVAGAALGAAMSTSTIGGLLIMGKAKGILIGTALAAAVATPLVLQYQTIQGLRRDNATLAAQIGGQESSTPSPIAQSTNNRSDAEHVELLRLRAEAARFRAQQTELAKLQEENQRLRAAAQPKDNKPVSNQTVGSDRWSNAGFATPEQALQTSYWAIRNANVQLYKDGLHVTEAAREYLQNLLTNFPPETIAQMKEMGYGVEEGIMFPIMAKDKKQVFTGYRIVAQETPAPDQITFGIELESQSSPPRQQVLKFMRFGEQWKQVIDLADVMLENNSPLRPK